MNIVFLSKNFPWSGAERVTMDVSNYLCMNGHHVTVLAQKHHEHLYPKGFARQFDVAFLPSGNGKYARRVAMAVRDFILEHQVEVMVTYRELLYAKWLKRQTGVKIVFELHNRPYYEFLDIHDKRSESRWKDLLYGCGLEWLLTRFYRSKYRRVYRFADAYGLLCEGFREEFIREFGLPPGPNKLWVLPNPNPLPEKVEWDKQNTVLYVGRLTHRDKRVDRLLRIWHAAESQLVGWRLKIVGRGKAEPKLRQLAAELGLQTVDFEGYTNDVQPYYDQAAILCLTSSFEGWGLVLSEAQANAVIPMAFNSYQAAPEIISTPEEGILVAPFDEEAFAHELTALALDADRRRRMQKTVVAKAATYSVERSGQAWEQMLQALL